MTHKDPVCGMDVDADTEHQSEHDGRRYYFCSADCKETFKRTPQQYAGNGWSREVH